jgi:hypothetical protein
MWRFLVMAALLVAAFIFAITQRKLSPPDLRISARPSGTPSAPRSQGSEKSPKSAVRGDAPWALSALPDCARQHSEAHGPPERVRPLIPRGARPAAGRLIAGPCSVEVTANGIFVTRGEDRLRIPPPARLLRWDDRYYLYTQDRKGSVLRVYSFFK